jgi:GNAT superfamily N-acetyltransferase
MPARPPTACGDAVGVRAFQADDEPRVLEVLQAAFGEWPQDIESVAPSEFFRWKYMDGPFGLSILLVAEANGEVVGFYAYLPWRFRAGESHLTAMRGVDLAVHPSHRRRGVSMAIRAAANFSSDVAFIWSNPSEQGRGAISRLDGAKSARCLALCNRIDLCEKRSNGHAETGRGGPSTCGSKPRRRPRSSVMAHTSRDCSRKPRSPAVGWRPTRISITCAGGTVDFRSTGLFDPTWAEATAAWPSFDRGVAGRFWSQTCASCSSNGIAAVPPVTCSIKSRTLRRQTSSVAVFPPARRPPYVALCKTPMGQS